VKKRAFEAFAEKQEKMLPLKPRAALFQPKSRRQSFWQVS
jgi:hypothetical protein